MTEINLVLRSTKRAPLTHEDQDSNMVNLREAIKFLQASTNNTIGNISTTLSSLTNPLQTGSVQLLQTRMTNAETDITTTNTKVGTINTSLGETIAKVNALDESIDTLSDMFGGHEERIDIIEGSLSTDLKDLITKVNTATENFESLADNTIILSDEIASGTEDEPSDISTMPIGNSFVVKSQGLTTGWYTFNGMLFSAYNGDILYNSPTNGLLVLNTSGLQFTGDQFIDVVIDGVSGRNVKISMNQSFNDAYNKLNSAITTISDINQSVTALNESMTLLSPQEVLDTLDEFNLSITTINNDIGTINTAISDINTDIGNINTDIEGFTDIVTPIQNDVSSIKDNIVTITDELDNQKIFNSNTVDALNNIGELLSKKSITLTTTDPDQQIDSFPDTFTTAKYVITVQNGSDIDTSELLLCHAGTTVYTSMSAPIGTVVLGTFSAVVDGNNIVLKCTPDSSLVGDISIKMIRHIM